MDLWSLVARKLDFLDSVTKLGDLRVPPGNMFETLSGNRQGQYNIRINRQYRICFRWTESGPEQWDLYFAQKKESPQLEKIHPYSAPS